MHTRVMLFRVAHQVLLSVFEHWFASFGAKVKNSNQAKPDCNPMELI